ncbi:hypothetical protein ScPMuIL_011615 [Solemya velum]
MSSSSDRLLAIQKHIFSNSRSVEQVTMSNTRSQVPPLTTHVLDTTSGLPATAMEMTLSMRNEISGLWEEVEKGSTDSDGRGAFLRSSMWNKAVYKLFFNTDKYFQANGITGFYPYVEVVFNIDDVSRHYHVPLC